MKAAEIIKALQGVTPDADVTVTTNAGTFDIDRVITTGYTGRATIITAD